MEFDNRKEVYRIWLQKFIATIIYVPSLISLSFSSRFRQPFYGIEREWLIAGVSFLYLIIILCHHVRKPYYVFYSDNGNKIRIRYYAIRAFFQKKKSIEIPTNKLVNFQFRKTLFGEKLVLYQAFQNRTAKYPPISLNALSKAERKKIRNSLQRHCQV